MRTPLAAAVLAGLLAATGCSGDGRPEAQPTPSGAVPPAGTSRPPSPSPSPSVAAVPVVLRADGLDVGPPASVQRLRFGRAPAAQLTAALTAALGTPVQAQEVECGQGPRRALGAAGFDVLLDGDRFVGWDESGGEGRDLVTDTGLRLGSTREDVQRALPQVVFTESSLGPEFASPEGLAGFLDGPGPTARVVGLTGGESCVVR